MDLPSHAAQIQTLASLLLGDRAVTERFSAQLVPGYGLVTWAMAPVAMVSNGAIAARLALFLSMAGLLPALALLLNRARLPEQLCFLAAPFAFSFSYWYGLLPELFARTLALLALAAWIESRRGGGPGREALAAALGCAVALAHVLTFGVLLLVGMVLALAERPRHLVRSLRSFLPAALIASWGVLSLREALGPQSWSWDGAGHLLFYFRNYQQEGRAGLVASLTLFAILLLPSTRPGRRRPALLVVAALSVAYIACPRDVGIAYVLCFRLPAFIGLAAVCASAPILGSRWRLGVAAACVGVALVQVIDFHVSFRRSVAGLVSVSGDEQARAFLALHGPRLPGTRLPYLEHLSEWITARKGGGHTGFFTEAPNQPVQARPGAPAIPPSTALYVYGAGPLPTEVGRWCVERSAFQWRRFDRDCPADAP